MLILLYSMKLEENKALARTFIRGLSGTLKKTLRLNFPKIAICYLLYLVIMLNPILTKELIKDKGYKYSIFFTVVFITLLYSSMIIISFLCCLIFIISWVITDYGIANTFKNNQFMKKNLACKDETNSGIILHKTKTRYI